MKLIAILTMLGATLTAAPGPTWTACDDKDLDEANARCTTVRVPLDYSDPTGRQIELTVSRIPAKHKRGVLLVNPGGPGGPGLNYPLQLKPLLGEVADQYDLIGVDVRFTGRSTPLTCGPVVPADLFGTPKTRTEFAQATRRAKAYAAGCTDDRLKHASITNAARDLDAIRQALQEPKISYYGVSWGADLGIVYSQLFGRYVDRMVVDSVTNVEGSEYDHLNTGHRKEIAFDEWAAWVAWRHDQYHLGETVAAVRKTVERLRDKPFTLGAYRIKPVDVPFLVQGSLGDESDYPAMAENVAAMVYRKTPPESLAGLLQLYYEGADGLDSYFAASFGYLCNDRGWPTGPAPYWREITRTKQRIFSPGILPCAFWPHHTNEKPITIGNDVPLLIVQAERDDIPLQWARSLHRKLSRSSLVTTDRRAHGVYDERVPCIVKTVNTYLTTGTHPADTCP
ncbi:alpha/beta hydrolase [Kribbella deserti]|uniref:Alpha/beta hydrolase n=1 Tax=Kribbella deserti TaxID=1926257 RepID=A0ABV6QZ85_9ACTN